MTVKQLIMKLLEYDNREEVIVMYDEEYASGTIEEVREGKLNDGKEWVVKIIVC